MYAVAFMLQIYFDFSGYSDMAIGLGRIFGFQFPENFNYPLISRSVKEFWRRWHISLSSWFRDYVYIPLGGSRVKTGLYVRNVIAVWMLTGLGMAHHGTCLVGSRFWSASFVRAIFMGKMAGTNAVYYFTFVFAFYYFT